MAAYASGIDAPGGWGWPEDFPGKQNTNATASNQPEASSAGARDPTKPSRNSHSAHSPQREQPKERHYKPRTCRICLETVLPTFHPPSESLPGVLQGKGRVTYDSEDGRLIRPCKCKGSSRYVHDTCLQEWRHADPGYSRRNFWQCPTCGFRYRLERMKWGRWVSSTITQIALTVLIFVLAIFALGFIADPIINLYMDPFNTIADTSMPNPKSSKFDRRNQNYYEEDSTWGDHFLKGFASLGVLGFVKMFFSLGPWNWLHWRNTSFSFGGGRAGTTGRDRAANISWLVLIVGVCTFLYTVWKGVRAWSRRVLEKAGERVMDVQGNDDDDDD